MKTNVKLLRENIKNWNPVSIFSQTAKEVENKFANIGELGRVRGYEVKRAGEIGIGNRIVLHYTQEGEKYYVKAIVTDVSTFIKDGKLRYDLQYDVKSKVEITTGWQKTTNSSDRYGVLKYKG